MRAAAAAAGRSRSLRACPEARCGGRPVLLPRPIACRRGPAQSAVQQAPRERIGRLRRRRTTASRAGCAPVSSHWKLDAPMRSFRRGYALTQTVLNRVKPTANPPDTQADSLTVYIKTGINTPIRRRLSPCGTATRARPARTPYGMGVPGLAIRCGLSFAQPPSRSSTARAISAVSHSRKRLTLGTIRRSFG